MGWTAGPENDKEAPGAAKPAGAQATPSGTDKPDRKVDQSVWWILGGLVVTGVVAGWRWVRSLPR